MSWLQSKFFEMIYGQVAYVVEFERIECQKNEFFKVDKQTDLESLVKYGFAVDVAQMFVRQSWLLTDSMNLISGPKLKNIPTLKTKIVIDLNLEFLATHHSRLASGVDAVAVEVVGLHSEKGVHLCEGPFSVLFINLPR